MEKGTSIKVVLKFLVTEMVSDRQWHMSRAKGDSSRSSKIVKVERESPTK